VSQAPQYRLTEEVVRQAVEVCFKKASATWQISFTNPTAGPWKKIRIRNYVDGTNLRYGKEEDRPDLILFAQQTGIFLILEAKDGIQELLKSQTLNDQASYTQLTKSMAVFEKEIKRIDEILEDAASSALVFGDLPRPNEITIVLGYIFPAFGRSLATQRQKLHEVHSALAKLEDRTDTRLEGCVSFIVKQQPNRDLTVHHSFYQLEENVCEFLQNSFPDSIIPFTESE
jgi:hypothetical protein